MSPPAPAALSEIFPGIFLVPGQNQSRFPFCSCLYLKGKRLRLLIDAGMGPSGMKAVKKMGVDLLLLTHGHIDHRISVGGFAGTPVWCHEAESAYMGDVERYMEATGISRSGVDVSALQNSAPGIFELKAERTVVDGQKLDLGGISLEIIHTPGHTPGHLAIYFPEHDFLFSADVDLTPFGPFYGHDYSDIDDFIASIRCLRDMDASMAATGHTGIVDKQIRERFVQYESIIMRREQKVLDFLDHPRPLEDFAGSRVIYPPHEDAFGLSNWFEMVHCQKHLARLEKQGAVTRQAGLWVRS